MVYQASPAPSRKALGKRPMRNLPSNASAATASVDAVVDAMANANLLNERATANGHAEDSDSCSAPLTTNGRGRGRGRGRGGSSASSASSVPTAAQKRVLPNRVRRGGPGQSIGTSDVDLSILDMLKRRGENEPLIPAKTVFILTTDSSLVPEPSTTELSVNPYATERYFDRPEVIKAYKAQQYIQTPEFWQLSDKDRVGSRLRTRSGESEGVDLSDTAYEKRHRKHELAEKRQRLREKEKLQHEHYKLKERIDQLRSAEYSTFLSLPAELFGNPNKSEDELHAPGTSTHSSSAVHEGERRRKMMLEVAMILEERYRILLPEKKLQAQEKHPSRLVSPSVEPIPREDGVSEKPYESEAEALESMGSTRSKPIKLKLKLRPVPISPSPLAYASLVARANARASNAFSDAESITLDSQQRTSPVEATSADANSRTTPSARSRASSNAEALPSGSRLEETPLPKTAPPPSVPVHPGMPTSSNFLVSFYSDPTKQIPNAVDIRQPMKGYIKQAYPGFDYALSNYVVPNQIAPRTELQVHHLGPEDFMERPRKKTKMAHAHAERSVPPLVERPANAPVDAAGGSRAEAEVAPQAYQFELQARQQERDLQASPLPHEYSWILEAQKGPPHERHVVHAEPTATPKLEALPYLKDTDIISVSPVHDHAKSTHEEHEEQIQEQVISTSSRQRRSSVATDGVESTPSAPSSPGSASARIFNRYDSRPGRGRRRAPLPCILLAASHYEGQGRKTGRSTLPFGTELPSFGQETDFELPPWLTEGVDMIALQRAASTETEDGGGMDEGASQVAADGQELHHGWGSGEPPGHEERKGVQRQYSSTS